MTRSLAFILSLSALAAAGCNQTRGGRGGGPGGTGCASAACHSCDASGKCLDCSTGKNFCNGGAVYECNPDGTQGAQVKVCSGTQACNNGDCQSACDAAAGSHSYIGCDYWPTTTLTGQLNPYFDFAVAVANPLNVGDVVQSASATVKVFRGGSTQVVATKTIAPGAVEVIMLPWIDAVSQNSMAASSGGGEQSALVKSGAYHLVSDLPVTVYQFSPLQFEKPATNDCMDPPYLPPSGSPCTRDAECKSGDRCVPYPQNPFVNVCQNTANCHSYSNDASILLPTSVLRNEYIAIARQTFGLSTDNGQGTVNGSAIPGFFTVVATEDGTTVDVTYSAYTEPGSGVPAKTPGSKGTYTLNKGDVLEVVSQKAQSPCATMSVDQISGGGSDTYCDLGPKYDLTGSHITSDKPIAVFGGHSCTFVPYNKWACDHIEEQMVPLDSWGQKVIVVQTEPQVANEPNVYRVVSGSDKNMITFDPPGVHAPVTLDTDKYVEFVAQGGFQASGSGRVAVGQYMVGENYFGQSMGTDVGDPSLGLGVPVEQFRNNYDFLTPTTYTKSYVNVVAPMGTTITLDGQAVAMNFTAIGGTGYGYKRLQVQPGAHHATGDAKFGITVSGIANYTSYLFVGGQDVNDIILQ